MRGDQDTDAPKEEPPPIPLPDPQVKIDFPSVICAGEPNDSSGASDDDLVLLHIFNNSDPVKNDLN